MEKISEHKILLAGDSFTASRDQVLRFFRKTMLVKYDRIQVVKEKSCNSRDSIFLQQLQDAEKLNRVQVRNLVEELKQAGFSSLDSLESIHQGYESKLLHILSHFLDGFIGIDSSFYNLIDDSHRLPENCSAFIADSEKKLWLLHLDCFAAVPEEAGLLHKSA
ncbi:hypothetical protein [Desulfomarina sp.]